MYLKQYVCNKTDLQNKDFIFGMLVIKPTSKIKISSLVFITVVVIFIVLIAYVQNHYWMTYSSQTLYVDDRFKILQISDTQIHSMNEKCRDLTPKQLLWPCDGTNTTAFVRRLVELEQPDFVVFAGDNVIGRTTKQAWRVLEQVIAPVIESNIPMGIVMGNHDRERKRVSIPTLYQNIRTMSDTTLVGNTRIKIHGPNNTLQVFLFDYAYGAHKLPAGGLRPWAKEQIDWYRSKSDRDVPTLVFGHLPLDTYKRLNKSNVVGDWNTAVTSANGKTQLWDAMQSQYVVAYSAGHNHINDFCGRLQPEPPLLCYSGAAGYTTGGRKGWPRRARVFIWNTTNVITYKRLDNGSIIDTQYVNFYK